MLTSPLSSAVVVSATFPKASYLVVMIKNPIPSCRTLETRPMGHESWIHASLYSDPSKFVFRPKQTMGYRTHELLIRSLSLCSQGYPDSDPGMHNFACWVCCWTHLNPFFILTWINCGFKTGPFLLFLFYLLNRLHTSQIYSVFKFNNNIKIISRVYPQIIRMVKCQRTVNNVLPYIFIYIV